MIGKKIQQVKAKPNEGDNRPVDKNGEAIVATVEVLDLETVKDWDEALDWLVSHYTTVETVVRNFVRQDTQDVANAARADYKTGGDRAAREARIDALTQRLLAGDVSAAGELKELMKKRGK